MDPTNAFDSIIQTWGPAGAIIVLLVIALYSRDKSYREVQDKRIEEHKANTERFLVATNANTDATRSAAEGFKAMALSNADTVKGLTEIKAQLASKGRMR